MEAKTKIILLSILMVIILAFFINGIYSQIKYGSVGKKGCGSKFNSLYLKYLETGNAPDFCLTEEPDNWYINVMGDKFCRLPGNDMATNFPRQLYSYNYKVGCVSDFAADSSNKNHCLILQNQTQINSCLANFAAESKNLGLCKEILDSLPEDEIEIGTKIKHIEKCDCYDSYMGKNKNDMPGSINSIADLCISGVEGLVQKYIDDFNIDLETEYGMKRVEDYRREITVEFEEKNGVSLSEIQACCIR